MKRRQFITLLSATVMWPIAARGQQPKRIGLLIGNYSQTDREGQASVAAFLDTFQKLGWTDGRNVRIEYRWDAGDPERTRVSAADLVGMAPDVIMVSTGPSLVALRRLTKTIPIVFNHIGDPVGSGYVDSLAKPGGNITGFQVFDAAIGGKWLGTLKEAAPNLRRVAMIFGSDSPPTVLFLRSAEDLAPSLGVVVAPVDVRDAAGVEAAVTSFAAQPDGGLIVTPHSYALANRASIFALAARHRLPAIYPYRYFATEGGLISYGPDPIDQWRGAASYVDRILRGEKPADLPVQAPTKFELVVNLKTAKATGLTIPPAFPLRADDVIE